MTTGDDRKDRSRSRTELRSFGRRRGRKLSPRQEGLLRELLPKIAVDPSTIANEIFCSPDTREVWLEIGFGGSEHLIWQAEHNAGVMLIGCEPFEEGVVKALTAIDEKGLANVRIYADDARHILRALPQASIARVFILFPDPWPKRKHAKRRLLNPETVALLARILRPGGELRIGTDIGDYVRTLLVALHGNPFFAWQARDPQDWRVRPDDWPQTRYEQKALREGRRGYFFRFLRRPG